MPRPFTERWVGWRPVCHMFKPAGIPARNLKKQQLSVDEVEALRLADAEGLDQVVVAEQMKVSRATVGRILESARRKAALALVHGQALVIADGRADIRYYGAGCCEDGDGHGKGCQQGEGAQDSGDVQE